MASSDILRAAPSGEAVAPGNGAIAPVADGALSAFDQAVRPQLERLYRLAFRLTGQRADAEDLLQDVLTSLFERHAELTSIKDLAPWLGRVLYNRFVDSARRLRKQRWGDSGRERVVLLDDAMLDRLAADEPGPETRAAIQAEMSRLQSALDALGEEHRVVVLLHDAEGYSIEEIQAVTGVAAGTVKSRLHRARARLRELLAG